MIPPGILWYVTHRRKLLEHGVQQVWILQHDIGWTGQLPSTLSLYSPHHDLLCEGLGEAAVAVCRPSCHSETASAHTATLSSPSALRRARGNPTDD